MRRRKLLKLISLSFFGLGGLSFLPFARWFNRNLASTRSNDSAILEKVAFIETVYPFFSKEELLEKIDIVLARKHAWEVIEKTFFTYFYSKSEKALFQYSLADREGFITKYIDESAINDEISLKKFTRARINIMMSLVNQSFSPFIAYGYPKKRVVPFTADPSWDEYHKIPGSKNDGRFET
jgi:hypothetical protein